MTERGFNPPDWQLMFCSSLIATARPANVRDQRPTRLPKTVEPALVRRQKSVEGRRILSYGQADNTSLIVAELHPSLDVEVVETSIEEEHLVIDDGLLRDGEQPIRNEAQNGEVVISWHGHQNHSTRDARNSAEEFVEGHVGGFGLVWEVDFSARTYNGIKGSSFEPRTQQSSGRLEIRTLAVTRRYNGAVHGLCGPENLYCTLFVS